MAKTFLMISFITIMCCAIIYGVVMYCLPRTYQTELEKQFNTEFQELTVKLERSSVSELSDSIMSFSIRNRASVVIKDTAGAEVISVNNIEENSNHDKKRFLTINASVHNMDGEYFVMATANFTTVSQAFNVLVRLLPFILFIIIAISVIGAAIFSKSYSTPLIYISQISKKMAALDMTWKCETNRTDEIGVLSSNLNDMSEQLRKNFDDLKITNEKLQMEIEKERKLERQRLEFFTAVSHELKTPITVIKGELQGMIYNIGEYKDHSYYLRHVMKTTSQMEKLVKEILQAAKMEADDFKLDRKTVNMSSLIKKCIHEIQGIAEDREMRLMTEIQEGILYQGDYQLLKKAFSNIIGNAVFHSPNGAEVAIKLKEGILIVENSGVHLADDDIEQLFIPFYRVDKSHNSSTGGSGLGLYISKTIFERHGIQYKIINTQKGVRFVVNY